MAALTNPLNTAEVDLEYSLNSGSAWVAFGSEIVDVQPSEFMRKEIQRKLLNVTRVQKYLGRIDYGDLKVILEYSSVTFALVLGWQTNKTLVWIRTSPEDSGGINKSSIVFKSGAHGGVKGVKPFNAPGDDEAVAFEFTLSVDDMLFTAGT
jgi:hypothetical protein